MAAVLLVHVWDGFTCKMLPITEATPAIPIHKAPKNIPERC